MIGEEGVGAPQDELIDELPELDALCLALGAILLRRAGLATAQDRVLIVAVEVFLSPKQARVGKVHHRVELIEVILNRRPREQHAPPRREVVERDRRLRVLVLQSMRLVTDEEAALVALLEDRLVQAEGLVRDDQDRTTAVHEACDQRRTRNDSERGLESSVGWTPA